MSGEMAGDTLTPLGAEALVRRCDPAAFPFETTAALDAPFGVVGQERAARALAFGIGVAHEGYNVFVMGPAGCGKHTLVEDAQRTGAPAEPRHDAAGGRAAGGGPRAALRGVSESAP
jgi:hypothetical protein